MSLLSFALKAGLGRVDTMWEIPPGSSGPSEPHSVAGQFPHRKNSLSLKGEASGAIGQNEQQADNVRAVASLDQQSDSTHTSGAVPRVRSPPKCSGWEE